MVNERSRKAAPKGRSGSRTSCFGDQAIEVVGPPVATLVRNVSSVVENCRKNTHTCTSAGLQKEIHAKRERSSRRVRTR